MFKTRRLPSTLICLATAVLLPEPAAWGAASTTALTLSASLVPVRTPVILTALVFSAATPVAPGLVIFKDGKAVLGSAQLLANGVATLTVRLGPGTHEITANFAGTKRYAASSSDQQGLFVSGQLATQTAIGFSNGPGSYALTGTITTSGSAAPAGTISFTDQTNTNFLGSVPLDAGTVVQRFQTQGTYDNGSGVESVVVGDFNGDGVPDLAAANTGSVGVRLGAGDGTFQRPQTTYFTEGSELNGIAAADFNGDGALDLVVINISSILSVLSGNGDGTFRPGSTFDLGTGARAIAVGDFNNDGVPDLVVIDGNDSLLILLGNGDGRFDQTTFTVSYVEAVAVGDFNGDGLLDLAVGNIDGNTVGILSGNGDGTFQPQTTFSVSSAPYELAVADFNGDGVLDLVVRHYSAAVGILLGNGDGTLRPEVTYTVGAGQAALAVGDFNGDGTPDLAVSNTGSNSVSVLPGNGDGTFQTQITYGTDSYPDTIAVGDFDGDGILDLAVGTVYGHSLDVLLNSLTESASLNNISVTGTGTHQVIASYNGDTTHLASSSAPVPLTATQIATTLNLSASPGAATSGQAITLTAVLVPSASSSLSTDGDSVSFLNNGSQIGAGTLSNGIATLNISSLPVGQDSITAAYPGDSNFMTSTAAAVIVTVSPPADFTVTVTPPAETAFRGRIAAFLLQLKSVNGFSGKVTLGCSGGPAGSHCVEFPKTISLKNNALALSGVFFPATTPSGTYTITFTAVSGPITHTATARFTVK